MFYFLSASKDYPIPMYTHCISRSPEPGPGPWYPAPVCKFTEREVGITQIGRVLSLRFPWDLVRGCIFRGILYFLRFYRFLSVLIDFYMVLMVLIGLNCYLNRYASNWTKFQLKWSVLDPNRGIFGKSAHGLLGWGTTLRELKVPSGIAPLKKNIFF